MHYALIQDSIVGNDIEVVDLLRATFKGLLICEQLQMKYHHRHKQPDTAMSVLKVNKHPSCFLDTREKLVD